MTFDASDVEKYLILVLKLSTENNIIIDVLLYMRYICCCGGKGRAVKVDELYPHHSRPLDCHKLNTAQVSVVENRN